jgi:hypothetical protein
VQDAGYTMVRAAVNWFHERTKTGDWKHRAKRDEWWVGEDQPARATAFNRGRHIGDEELRRLAAQVVNETAELNKETDPAAASRRYDELLLLHERFAARCGEVVRAL